MVEANGSGGEGDPAAIRPALAQLAAENLDGLHGKPIAVSSGNWPHDVVSAWRP